MRRKKTDMLCPLHSLYVKRIARTKHSFIFFFIFFLRFKTSSHKTFFARKYGYKFFFLGLSPPWSSPCQIRGSYFLPCSMQNYICQSCSTLHAHTGSSSLHLYFSAKVRRNIQCDTIRSEQFENGNFSWTYKLWTTCLDKFLTNNNFCKTHIRTSARFQN